MAANRAIYIDEIASIRGLRYTYSDKVSTSLSQLDAYSNARLMTSVASNTGYKLTDGPTLASVDSDYTRLTTLWIVRKAMEITRNVAKDYLGLSSNIQVLQALETRLKADLTRMKPDMLQGFAFKIKSSPRQRVLGELEIVLELAPVFEIRSITIPVTLKADESALMGA